MVQIRNNKTGEIYNLHGASKKYCTKDNVIIDRLITIKFRRNWPIFVFFEPYTSCTMCTLKDGYEVII